MYAQKCFGSAISMTQSVISNTSSRVADPAVVFLDSTSEKKTGPGSYLRKKTGSGSNLSTKCKATFNSKQLC